jgi:hypothetical protein
MDETLSHAEVSRLDCLHGTMLVVMEDGDPGTIRMRVREKRGGSVGCDVSIVVST